MDKEKNKKYSIELTKLLKHLEINNPTPLQERMFKELNQEEREIYINALQKKEKADRKQRFKLIKQNKRF